MDLKVLTKLTVVILKPADPRQLFITEKEAIKQMRLRETFI